MLDRPLQHERSGTRARTRIGQRERGAILLEIVIGIGLFVLTAAFVLTGLNASVRATRSAHLDADAADLCVSVLSHIQMGEVAMVSDGPWPFDEPVSPDWTWEVVVNDVTDDPLQLTQLRQVEVTIRHANENVTQRLTQLMWENPEADTTPGQTDDTTELPALPGGGL